MDEPWQGLWLSCDNTISRHPIFEREIAVEKPVALARLYVCGLGLYEIYCDSAAAEYDGAQGDGLGARVSGEYLAPGCTDYDQWVQYQTYDLTRELRHGGRLSILLGNGWYKGRFGFIARGNEGYYGNEWKLLAELHLTFEDGTTAVIGTDHTWRVRRSNIIFSNIYDGEQADDTLPELPVEKPWLCPPPKGRLCERFSLPVTIHETIAPVKLLHTPAGEMVLDMGQIFSGIFAFNVHVPKGTQVHLMTGEVLQNGCFYNDNLRSAKSEYIYISDGQPTTIRPHFTFYGYRYVKVEGVPELRPEDFTGLALYSDIDPAGWMQTGHALVNQLISNVRWGMKGNFVDVPSDCPQRDERMGWTADTQVFSPTATYLADTWAFYAKYLHDMWQEQQAQNGKVPDVIPSFGTQSCAAVWGDAACIIPWNLYLYYGDKEILARQYDSMKAWVDYVRRIDGSSHHWREVFQYGDWLALDNRCPAPDSVLGGTDEGFIANIYYAASARTVAKAAAILGFDEDARAYGALADEQFEIVRKEYYSATGRCCIDTQTGLLLTLKYHLSSDEDGARRRLERLFAENSNKLKTGFVGTPLLCNILSENGLDELAYELLLNEEYPGWLHEILLGATTVWERWNSLDDERHISSTGMNSLNHYSYGSIVEWLFAYAAGIRPLEDTPGFRRAVIAPRLSWKLGKMDASYASAAGTYKVFWEMLSPSRVHLKVEVPFVCLASLTLPLAGPEVFNDQDNPMFAEVVDGQCLLEAGSYEVTYDTLKSLKKVYHTGMPVVQLMANKELCEAIKPIIDLTQTPSQYRLMSLTEMPVEFGGITSPEILEKLNEIMAACS